MKSIKRCAKLEHKIEEESDISSDKQGTYYQFLIERKVPKGILRHIPALKNITYEFIPDNLEIKRRKANENSEISIQLNHQLKENSSLWANQDENLTPKQLTSHRNCELKRLEDKSSVVENIKDSGEYWKGLSMSGQEHCNSTGPTEEGTPDIIKICKQYKNKLVVKKSLTHYPKESHLNFLKRQKLIPWNLKMGSKHEEKCANPACSDNAKYFITYVPKLDQKPIKYDRRINEISLKRSKSMHHVPVENSANLGIKRNPKVKYVKAEVFRKHERIRDQEFENKISQLMSFNNVHNEHPGEDEYGVNNNSNFKRNLLENSNAMDWFEEESEVDQFDQHNDDFVIAQHYGSFDEEDRFHSSFSSLKGDSLPGDFNLEIVGSKLNIPKLDDEHQFDNGAFRPNNVSHLGSKIIFGEPSGDLFGIALDVQCDGIFANYEGVHNFQPVNTLQTDN